MTLVSLLRQAVGTDPAREVDWESLQSPETDLLPALAARVEAPSSKAQGLRRYTWLRYQMLLGHAKKVAGLGAGLVLTDDLHVAGHYCAHPSDRVLHGIDFLAPRGWDKERQESLLELGWQKPSWPDGADFSEWVQPDGTRLRFHWEWLRLSGIDVESLETTTGRHGMSGLSGLEQLYRSCYQGPSHLWMVDAVTLTRKDPTTTARHHVAFSVLPWRWSRLVWAEVGHDLNLPYSSKLGWTPAQWVLALCHRGGDPYRVLLEELAFKLVCDGQFGWPHHWLEGLRHRWSLSSSLQIPKAYLQRRRGDFS